jgi:regulator of protease activity HflC (stomatin/prohibitin superfamily)
MFRLTTYTKRNFITIIDQATCAYREFVGQSRTKLEPGIRLNLPILHKITYVDLREQLIKQSVTSYTKDNVPVNVNGALFFKINDPALACYGISNYINAIEAVGMSAIRSTIGQFEYDEIIRSRSSINDALSQNVDISKWGALCTKFEITNFEPKNKEIARQLELQMEAERKRRENELNTQAHIRTSEGEKLSQIFKAEGVKQSQILEADARKYAIDTQTDALARQIDEIAKQFNNDKQFASKYILERQRLEHLISLASSSNNKIYFIDPKHGFSQLPLISEIFNKNN